MRCAKCNGENPDEAKFCGKCGAKLIRTCPQCGAELPADLEVRFCFQCGAEWHPAAEAEAAPLEAIADRLRRLIPKQYGERLLATRGQPHDERRTVTILFCDVKGSTAMAEKLDPEEVKEIMDGAFEFLIPPIFRYEGTLTQLMGDAILAFFGAPIAHEDDPERAMRAALEIITGAKEYAAKLEQERGIKGFNVRVGVNTGLVVVGELGSDLRVAYTATGDAINLAARMETAAEPGTILITDATHMLIAPLFETESLGRIEVKGKSEPVAVYRVLAAKEVAGKPRGIPGLESPLVGREAESAALREAVERLHAGVGGIVTIVGEAGIGKSRLVAECRTDWSRSTLRQHGQSVLEWLEGRCLSYGGAMAYGLWLDVLRGLLGVTLDDSPKVVRVGLQQQAEALCSERFDEVYPYLGRLMSLPLERDVAARLDQLDGQELKSRTFQALQTLIECAASERPLVLVCEDLHWADPTSIELLEQVLAFTERMPLLLLCVFRPLKHHACWRFRELAAQTHAQCYTDLLLEPLSPTESHTLVANLLEAEDLPQVLRERILDRAEGNPFYVEEVIRSLIDRGAVVPDEATGRWTATREVATIPIPDTLQGVLTARIDRLQEDTKRVLQMASVIGRIFLYRVLAAIAEEERRLDEQLGTLQREEMIRERARIPEQEYIFKHDLTREAAYNGLLKRDRRVFHRQVAEALERLFPERVEEQLGLMAYHWELARDAEKAVHYLQRAGDKSRLAYALEEAVGYYERALALLKEKKEHEQAARTLMKMGLVYHTAFDFERSRKAYEEGFALWQSAGAATSGRTVSPLVAPHALRLQYIFTSSPLDPATSKGDSRVLRHIFSGLVQQTPETDIVPDVARAWEVSEGGRSYVFHLREDVHWSDGTPVTAEDFCYAWKRVLDPAMGSPHARLLLDVSGARAFHNAQGGWQDVGVRAIDGSTLLVELESPTGYFLQLLDCPCTYPVPRHAVEAHGETWTEPENLVTNGPFRMEAWNRGESMVLVRNPSYYGRFAGNVGRVELHSCEDVSVQLQRYQTDRLDVLNLWTIPRQEISRARRRHAGEFLSAPWLVTLYLGFNHNRPPFDDVRVRRAFALGCDWEEFAEVVLGGHNSAATGGFIPEGMPGHSPGIALRYDPDRARQLLSEAGYQPGGRRAFPIVQALSVCGDMLQYEYTRTRWRENLGVEVRSETVEARRFLDMFHKEPPHMWVAGWGADYPDPDSFLRVGVPWEMGGWRNEAYEDLVERARRNTDQAVRMEMYRQADRILVQEAVIKPVTYGRKLMLVKPWVRAYPTSAMQDCFWKDVIIEPH